MRPAEGTAGRYPALQVEEHGMSEHLPVAPQCSPSGPRRWKRRVLVGALVVLILLLAFWSAANAWAYYHLQEAKVLLESHRLRSAREHLRLCRKVWRSDPEVCFLAARTARRMGDMREAWQILGELDKRGDLADGVGMEHRLHAAQEGDIHLTSNFWPLIEDDHPESALMLEAACVGYSKHSRWTETLHSGYKLAKLQPDNPIGWYRQGIARDERFEVADARDCYARVIELDPENDEARLRLAYAWLSLNGFREAAEQFKIVGERNPQYTRQLGGLVACKRCLGQYEEAFDLVEKLLEESPDLWPLLAERGRLALDLGQPAEAERWLRRSLVIEPFNSETNYSLFVCLSQLERHTEAAEVKRKLDWMDRLETRARALLKQVTEAPRNPEPRCELACAYLEMGKDQEGFQMLRNLLQEFPTHVATNTALADYFEKKGDTAMAQRHRNMVAGR
jgi:tetratricopeptide (TPR) repeat protein